MSVVGLDLPWADDYVSTMGYPGALHGLCATHKDQVNADLLAFLKS